ncbi:cytosine permease [Streptomyces sp. NPDC005953]|uniref:purine-cytosine permease family protein n=1 Tax=unclassified Streptomyces TaxID=2593676 RepID=UPI0033CBEBC5
MPIAEQTDPERTSANAFGKIESRGIDRIPDDERHGHPRELVRIWAFASVNYLYIILGGLLIVFGLTVWQGLAVVVVGNLFWAAIGLLATSGPVSGTPSGVITRAMFGTLGNRVIVGLFSWPSFIAYGAINLSVGGLAAFAFTEQVGMSAQRPVQIVIVLLIAALTLTISVYGYDTILKVSGAITTALALCMAVLGGFVLTKADWNYAPAAESALSGGALWAVITAGIALTASSPLSWAISPDYARYLPADTSRKAVATWTALGGFIPAVLLGSVGVLAGSVVDMADAQKSLATILPGWFYPVFLLVIVIGSITNNVITLYSSGLCLQSVGLRLPRMATVLLCGLLGTAIACYALFISDFTDALSNILELSVAFAGPWIAIIASDLLMRHNRYDGVELHDESPQGPYWFSGGTNWAGCTALVAGTTVGALCMNTTLFTGPIASALGGADLTFVFGPTVAACLYLVLVRTLYPAQYAVARNRTAPLDHAVTTSTTSTTSKEN